MRSLGRLVDALGAGWQRSRRQTRDPNFIGFDKYAKHGAYHWNELDHNQDYRSKADFLRTLVKPSDSLLDLGCGDGAYVFSLADDAARVVGIDADFDGIRLARRKLKQARVRNARVEQLPLSKVGSTEFTSAPFDIVYSMDVIEHLPRPEELLEAAARVVRTGGLIVIGTPLFIRKELVSAYHVKEFTRGELTTLLRGHVDLAAEHVLPEKRSDGATYESYYVAVARPRSRSLPSSAR